MQFESIFMLGEVSIKLIVYIVSLRIVVPGQKESPTEYDYLNRRGTHLPSGDMSSLTRDG